MYAAGESLPTWSESVADFGAGVRAPLSPSGGGMCSSFGVSALAFLRYSSAGIHVPSVLAPLSRLATAGAVDADIVVRPADHTKPLRPPSAWDIAGSAVFGWASAQRNGVVAC